MATTRDALINRLIHALRGIWRGGSSAYADRETALETIRQLATTAAPSNDVALQLANAATALRQLSTEEASRRAQVEQLAAQVKAIQPLLGAGTDRIEIGKLNAALGERRAGRDRSAKTPRQPAIVHPLPPDAAAITLPNVGPKVAGLLEQLVHGTTGGQHTVTVEDILRINPRRYVDYSNLVRIGQILNPVGDITVEGEIIDIKEQYGRARPYTEARLSDDTGVLRLIWFSTYISKQLAAGDRIYASGSIKRGPNGGLEILTPEWEKVGGRSLSTARIAPVYPLTKGLYQKTMRGITRSALDATRSKLVDWLADAQQYLDPALNLSPIDITYERLHYPQEIEEIEAARRRLQFENHFLLQLGLVLRKQQTQTGLAHALEIDRPRLEAFTSSRLPFALTNAQQSVLGQIAVDLAKPSPMTRLLQGDVGSGKTAVAAIAALVAKWNGYQSVVMAPTELLAEQHLGSIQRLFAQLPEPEQPRIALLTGSTRAKARREIDAALQSGEIDILVGTHALVQDNVTFGNLAFVVLDEQHRFGVRQRAQLVEKGRGVQPHVLSMTATPIPRTLNLVLSGDLDVSIMNERPAGRIPTRTFCFTPAQRHNAETLVREQVALGHQVFVICPLVEESDAVDAKAAVEEAQRLHEDVFPDLRVDVVHGKMSARKKDAVMTSFRDHESDILVSTSVIEVGIDIPNATVMLIEGAERFGLSQLHQFRGRVGRGAAQSYCLLLPDNVTPDGNERLQTMVATDDGFVLAEKDLELRGPGDFMGTRQSGLPELGWLNDGFDTRLLASARESAERLIADSPTIDLSRFPRLRPRLQHYWASAAQIDATKS